MNTPIRRGMSLLDMTLRSTFLYAVERFVPDVLADLHRDVFPTFEALFARRRLPPLRFPWRSYWSPGMDKNAECHVSAATGKWFYSLPSESGAGELWACIQWRSGQDMFDARAKGIEQAAELSWALEFGSEQLNTDRLTFRAAVLDWARTHHLRDSVDDWVLDSVLATLLSWLQCGRNRTTRWNMMALLPVETPPVEAPKLLIEEIAQPWETWAETKQRINSKVEHFRLACQGYSRSMNPPRSFRQHCAWLALFQCKELWPYEIVDCHGKERIVGNAPGDPGTVRHAIEEIAESIGIELRPADRGRPPRKRSCDIAAPSKPQK